MLPADKAHLLVTTEMSSVIDARRVDAEGRAVMIDLPIKDNFVPNIFLSVAYVKDGEMFSHSKSVTVPARNKFLNIEVIPDKKQYKPRDPASYTIIARNADGSPAAGAEVSLGVVDEAIYSIRPDSSGDIRRAFYGARYNRVETHFSTAYFSPAIPAARRWNWPRTNVRINWPISKTTANSSSRRFARNSKTPHSGSRTW